MGLLTSLFGGSDSRTSSTANTTENLTTNTDNRQALQDAIGVGAGGSYFSSSTASDSHDLALADSHNFADGSVHVDNSITYAADAEVLRTLASTLPDSAVALAGYGAQTLAQVGGAVVDMSRDSMAQNARSFDAVVSAGAGMVDKLINASVATAQAGTALATTAVQSFEPEQNKQADMAKYIAWGLAAAVAAAAIFRGRK